jgi:hypothetical protein
LTLILTFANPAYVLQVSDRLVTVPTRGRLRRAHDAAFNKHILFEAKNGIVSIGFSGLAYLKASRLTNGLPLS